MLSTIKTRFQSDRTLIVPDTHVPYNDDAAWLKLCDFARDFKPDLVILLGDFLDFEYLSTFEFPASRIGGLPGDLNKCSDMLARLQSFAKVDTIEYLGGNHEQRIYTTVNKRAPMLASLVDFERVLHDHVLGSIRYHEYRKKVLVNDVVMVHDFKRHGKYAVKQTLDKFQVSFVQGHLHKSKTESLRVNGKIVRGHCAGWLGDPSKVTYKEAWDSEMDYQTGFMYGEKDFFGNYELRHVAP